MFFCRMVCWWTTTPEHCHRRGLRALGYGLAWMAQQYSAAGIRQIAHSCRYSAICPNNGLALARHLLTAR